MYWEDLLAHAYARVKSSKGAGVDGQSFLGNRVARLGGMAARNQDLPAITYQPLPVLPVKIPRAGGGEQPLGIPTIRDRVVQTAAERLLEPILKRASIRMPMAIGGSEARKRRSRKCTSYFVQAIPIW
jgi:RNA-directed DNA polymerase